MLAMLSIVMIDNYKPLGLRDVQLRLLRNLKAIAYIFDNSGVRYFLSFGSLLGAVRHNGFIPWDDDLDIHIHHDDYNRAVAELNNNLPSHLAIVHHSSDMPWDVDFRLIDLETKLDEGVGSYSRKLCIDFFKAERCHPFSGVFVSRSKKVMNEKKRKIGGCEIKYNVKFFFVLFFYKAISLLPGKSHWFVNDKISAKTFSSASLWPLKTISFEDGLYPVPANTHDFLSVWYGDYMHVPPRSEQNRHFVTCYIFHKIDKDKE